jgi:hypothetical protein
MNLNLIEAQIALFQNNRDKLVELRRNLFVQHIEIHTAIRKLNEALDDGDNYLAELAYKEAMNG